MSFSLPGLVARVAAGSALGCLLSGACLAQPVVPPTPSPVTASSATPTLAQAAESAWHRAVQAREAGGQARRAQAERSAVDSLWAAPPSLELSHRDDRWQTAAGRRETEAGLAWPLWLPGQRSARGAAIDVDLELAKAAVEAGKLHYAGLVREAAWAISAQRAELVLAGTQLRYLQGIAEDVDRRVTAGDLAHADALAASAEALAARAALHTTRQQLALARSQWALLTGMEIPADPAVASGTSTSPASTPQRPSTFLAESHPDARVARLTLERAKKRLDVVSTSRRDPPELLLRLRQDVPGRGESAQNSIGIGVRIPFGTQGRNQPLEAAALSEVELAETQSERTHERLAAQEAQAQAAVQAAEQRSQTEHQRALLLRERATLIERSFKAGETPLPELLRAISAAAQAEAGHTRHQAALGLARARLEQALGNLP